jgi:iron complex outermembrane recepter protein
VNRTANTVRKNTPEKISLFGTGLSVLTVAIASASYTERSYAEELRVIEEVVVTARRREESLQDIPVAVSVLSGDLIREQNIVELNDLGTQVPSFRVSTGGTSTNEPVLSIRGQRPTDSAISLDAAIPIYFNDVVLTPSMGTNLVMYDLENVQVLKGPQGTLFGRNSTGGALLLTSKRPGKELGGYVEAKVGDYNLFGLEGAVDYPISDSVQARVAARMLTRDGYQENLAPNNLDDTWDDDSRAFRLSLNFEQDQFSNLFILGFDENDTLARVPVPTAFNSSVSLGKSVNALWNYAGQVDSALAWQASHDADQIQTDVKAEDKVENTVLSNITEFDVNDNITLKNIFGYRDMSWDRSNDADGTALPIFGAPTSGIGPDDGTVVTRNPSMTTTDTEQFSNEFQVIGTAMEGKLDWLTGLYVFKMEGSQRGDVQVAGPNPDHPGLAFFPQELQAVAVYGVYQSAPAGDVLNEALGVFGEATYRFDEQWSATLGLRQSWDDREVTVRNFSGLGGPLYGCAVLDKNGDPVPSCQRTESESFSSPTWRVSANYTPDDEQLIYASISTGYRSGGFNIRGTDNDTLKPFDEETVTTFEVGHKGDWRLGSIPLRTNFAAYYQDYQDIQKTQAVQTATGFGTATVNAGEAEIMGFEFDVMVPVTERLVANFAYSFVDTEYKEWDSSQTWADASNNGARTNVDVDLTDSEFVYMPEQTLTASLRYLLPVPSDLGEMSVMASVYWQDEMNTDETSVVYDQQAAFEGWTADDLAEAKKVSTADSYAVLNLRYEWRDTMGAPLDVSLFVNNATDEEYIVGGLNVIDALGWAAFTYGAPRTIGASLRYSF